ncbi:hypothetical protein TWF106_000880 [Orbilia oligospora]|uniref:Uncharacterized protein n=1 Tax=Orbilia oligospora TaxID=2813651 RepID=A0A7C8QC07_ORBOL|nr:hypothetical protein TWF679_009882 [Orbilia oligospora]KAF3206187.1 hypothetical protein TWF106_000880 [Orbilia oligospora]
MAGGNLNSKGTQLCRLALRSVCNINTTLATSGNERRSERGNAVIVTILARFIFAGLAWGPTLRLGCKSQDPQMQNSAIAACFLRASTYEFTDWNTTTGSNRNLLVCLRGKKEGRKEQKKRD